ncbi:hypothetical protein BD770DRAFT_416098 [Pilaira anomala]|nr:hypothetical protein BD770DRAFT_416098 [Pilaira anomala]
MYELGLWWSFYNLSIFSLALACFKEFEISLANINFENGHPLSKVFFFYNLCFAVYHRELICDFVTTSVITLLKKYSSVKQLISKPKLSIVSTNKKTKESNKKTKKFKKKTNKSNNQPEIECLSNWESMFEETFPKKTEIEILRDAFKALKSVTKHFGAAEKLVTKFPKQFNEEIIRQSCRLMLIELLVFYRKTRLRPLLRFVIKNDTTKHMTLAGEILIAFSVLISKSLDLEIIKGLNEDSPQVAILLCLFISNDDYLFNYILCRMEPFNEKEKELIRNSSFNRVDYLKRDYKRAELSFIEKFMRKNIFMHGQPLLIKTTQFNFSNKLRHKYKGVIHKSPLLFSNQPPEDQKRKPKAFRVTEKPQRITRIQKQLLCNFINLDDPREFMVDAILDSRRATEEVKKATEEAEKALERAKNECIEIIKILDKEKIGLDMDTSIKMQPFILSSVDKEQTALGSLRLRHLGHISIFDKIKTLLNHSESIQELNSIYEEVFMTPEIFSDPLKLEHGLLELRMLYDTLIIKFDDFQYILGQYDREISMLAVQALEMIFPPHPSFYLTERNYISSS